MRNYKEILGDVNYNSHTPRELRALHKELKAYGDGIFFKDRYPIFPIYVGIVALAVEAVILALLIFM